MAHPTESDLVRMETFARAVRASVLRMLASAGSGHTAGSLSAADLFAALYGHVLTHDPERPEWEARDRLILSNGHVVPVRYAAMAHAGYFPVEELTTLRRFGSRLQGHPERTRLPGLETTSGPLGEGLGQAVGIALGARMDGCTWRTYCIMSDAEQQCGATWEAVLFAGARKLKNLTALIDRNMVQIGGPTETVLPLEPLVEKYEAFGWHVIEVDGHSVEMCCDALEEATTVERPTVLIAHTVPGKGVPEIEGDYRWHGMVPTSAQAEVWAAALEASVLV